MKEDTIEAVGVPTLALLPAKNFAFSVNGTKYGITIPSKGRYVDLDTEFFSEEEGEFVVYSNNSLNIAVITKILFATKQYPELEENQLFCPTNFVLDDNTITIYGQVVTMTGPTE